MNRRRLLATGALALTLPAWRSVAGDQGGLTIYNAQHESLTAEWVARFTAETGIFAVVRNGSDTEFANQIVAEGAASPADLFLTENSPAMALVDHAGLFAPVDAATLAQVPAQFRPADGHWIGIAARSTVFVYNKDRLAAADLPQSLLDLARPEWKGRWAASPSGADFQAIVAALLHLKGEAATAEWLAGMKANAAIYRGNGTVMKAVNAGEIDGGVIYHYYVFGDRARTGENSGNVALHYFHHGDPGAFVSVSGGGVLASSAHPQEAQAFLKWLTGKGGQDVLRNGSSFEYAVNGASNPALEPLDALQPPQVEPSDLDSVKVTELMTAAGLL
jgi:iron(III) transport system substrate-binding protein